MPQGCWRGWSSTTIHQKHSNVPREIENRSCNLLNANRYCSYPLTSLPKIISTRFCLWIPLHAYIYIYFFQSHLLCSPKSARPMTETRGVFPRLLSIIFSPQTDLMGCNGPSAPRPSNCHFPWSPPSFDSSCLSLILAGS